MKKLILILILSLGLVFLLGGATAQADLPITITDTFDSFNTSLWTDISRNGGWVTAENGYLDLGTTGGVRLGRGKATSVFKLSGDFDTYFDYTLPAFNDYYSSACLYVWATDESFGMRVARAYSSGGNDYEGSYQIGGNWQGDWSISTNDASGKLRIVRTGNTLRAYYFSGGSWVLGSTSNSVPNNVDVQVIFEIGSDGWGGNAPQVEAHYDNFYAQADNILY